MTSAPRQALLWKALLVALLGVASGAAFMAYLRPDMLINFANLVLCY